MSISSSDHTVVPENDVENIEVVEAAEAVVAQADETPVADTSAADTAEEAAEDAEPSVTFADLGLPEGVVRKLAQNGVTTPSRSRPRPSRTPW